MARVLTFEEAMQRLKDGTPYWPEYRQTECVWNIHENYGRTWRVWDEKPTYEERQWTPWRSTDS